ncbi:MAG TPA: sulfatase-like hydrolase/transferase, partial [Thermoanaerobaculia bacterium]|nr:sulfatase-like hydrolase/transferase [Thermoanaerobaculia bacterium]
VRIHPFALMVVILLAFFGSPSPRSMAVRMWAFVHVLMGAILLFSPVLSHLKLSHESFNWALAFLEPVATLGLIDLIEGRGALVGEKETEDRGRIFQAALFSALFLALTCGALAAWRIGQGQTRFGQGDYLWITIWSISAHLVVAMAAYLVLLTLRAAANFLFVFNFDAEFVLLLLFSAVLISMIVHTLILGTMNFRGPLAQLFAAAVGMSVALLYGGTALSICCHTTGEVDSGIDLAFQPLIGTGPHRRMVGWIFLVGSLCFAAFVLPRISVLDWNFLFQKLGAVVLWALVFVAFYALSRTLRRDYTVAFFCVAALSLGFFKANQVGSDVDRTGRVSKQQLDRYAAFNPSLLLIRDVLTPPSSVDEAPLYRLIQESSNIPRSLLTPPVELDFVSSLPAVANAPNIFIIVIDSLRRDYLSPYNPKVTFTPAIDGFARENIVFRNAFTRYGGTGLSEPSIWVGGMILHKQYVSPFHPMNRLEKLLDANRYRSYLGMDPILQAITRPSPLVQSIDTGGLNADLCVSLTDMERRVAGDSYRPLFMFVQPQNIHIAAINREGNTTEGHHYPGFHDPYAWRLERIDECFGKFIDTLKRKGLYDESIVVITSDHGDSLGEEGRWGHAYTIFPEVMKIPLIIHLPPALRSSVTWNPAELAFSTDITPSLYYLLGYRGLAMSEFSGRSLFRAHGEAEFVPEDSYLVASSYGAVFGIMAGDGKSLYIADALNFRDYSYDMVTGEPLVVSATEEKRRRLAIEQKVQALNRIFHYTPPATNAAAAVMR